MGIKIDSFENKQKEIPEEFKELAKNFDIKVFADYHKDHLNYDKKVDFNIVRVGGIKILKKYRKAYLINDFIKQNNNIDAIIADHWKSLELIKTNQNKICLIHSKEINHLKGTNINKRLLKVLNNVKIHYKTSNNWKFWCSHKYSLDCDSNWYVYFRKRRQCF